MIELGPVGEYQSTNSAIGAQISETAENIRQFSASQKVLWQQLPFLALQSDGNSGYTSFASKLYREGILHIDSGDREGSGLPGGLFGTFVDCADGRILSLFGELDLTNTASDTEVVRAWLPNGQKFDATKWLIQYRESAVRPHSGVMDKSELEVREWRMEIVRDLGLKSIYERPKP